MQTLVALGQAVAFYPQNLPLFSQRWVTFRRLETPDNPDSQKYSIRLIYRPDNNINGLNYFREFLKQN